MKKLLFFLCAFLFVLPIFSQSSISNNELILFMAPNSTSQDLEDLLVDLEMELVSDPTPNLGALLVKLIDPPAISAGGNPLGPITGKKQKASVRSEVAGVGFNYFVSDLHQNSGSTESCHEDILNTETQPNGGNSILTGIFDTGISVYATTQATDFYNPSYMGFNFINPDNPPLDENGHGTHIASIIMNNLENQNNVIQLRSYKTHNNNGQGSLFDVIQALDLAITDGVDIINMSFIYMEEKHHGNETKNAFKYALSKAFSLSEMLIIAAAGNDNNDNDFESQLSGLSAFPASFNNPNIISVASSDCLFDKSSFSNYGTTSVDVFAPGENILGLNHLWQPLSNSGTSQATAFVTKLATYLGSHQQTFNWETVKCAILNSTDPMKTLGYTLTDGYINSQAALDYLTTHTNCEDADYREEIEFLEKDYYNQSVSYLANRDIPTFEIIVKKEAEATVSIANINGEILVNEAIQLTKGRNIYTRDFPKTESIGLYFIIVQTKNKVQTSKFIK